MKLSILATLALAAGAIAQGGGGGGNEKKLPVGAPCKQDGSLGSCESGFCLAQGGKQGTCKQK